MATLSFQYDVGEVFGAVFDVDVHFEPSERPVYGRPDVAHPGSGPDIYRIDVHAFGRVRSPDEMDGLWVEVVRCNLIWLDGIPVPIERWVDGKPVSPSRKFLRREGESEKVVELVPMGVHITEIAESEVYDREGDIYG